MLEESHSQLEAYLEVYQSAKDTLSLEKERYVKEASARNFYLIVNNIPENVEFFGDINIRSATSLSYLPQRPDSENLDTVRSGESLIKNFSFDTSKYNGETSKCVAFWKYLAKTGLQPIKSKLYAHQQEDTKDIAVMTEPEEKVENKYIWYRALLELQEQKMDETAFATSTQQCKLCTHEEPYSEFKKKQEKQYTDSEIGDDEGITCLNDWKPFSKAKAALSQKPSFVNREEQQLQIPSTRSCTCVPPKVDSGTGSDMPPFIFKFGPPLSESELERNKTEVICDQRSPAEKSKAFAEILKRDEEKPEPDKKPVDVFIVPLETMCHDQ